MAGKPVVLVDPVKVAKGRAVDAALAKGAEKAMRDAAVRAFKAFDAVTSAKKGAEGFQFEPTLTALSEEDGVVKCAIESVSHPLSALKPLVKSANAGEIKGGRGGGGAVADLIDAVMEAHVKKVEGALKRMK